MELESWLKIILVVLGVVGATITCLNFSMFSRESLREQYKFAREVMKDFKEEPNMHPFLKEKALQAVVGNKSISKEEVEYILSLKDSSVRLNEFSKAKHLIERFNGVSLSSFSFRGRFKFKWYRRFLKSFYLVVYFSFAFAAFSPVVLSGFLKVDSATLWPLSIFTFFVFGFYAFVAANAFVKLRFGESLVSNQSILIRNISLVD